MINFIVFYNCVFKKNVLLNMHKILSLKDNKILYVEIDRHDLRIYKSPI